MRRPAPRVIRELRRKFALVTAASALIVLVALVGAVNVFNYHDVVSRADAVVNLLLENGGSFPDAPDDAGTRQPGASEEPGKTAEGETGVRGGAAGDGEAFPAQGGATGVLLALETLGGQGDHGALGPETPFSTRYFTVTLASDGSTSDVDVSHVAAVTQDEARQYASDLFAKGATSGFVGTYRFGSAQADDGGELYVFVDCSRDLATLASFATSSLLVAAACLAFVTLVAVALSPLAVRPVAVAYAKQKRFITDASHELKTPLTIIDANTEILEMEQGASEWTASTKRQVARLTDLVQKLLFMARMDEGSQGLARAEFSMSEAVAETVAPFATVAAAQGKSLDTRVAPGLSYVGDRSSIEQVASILAENALKYCGDGGQVRVTLERVERRCRLTVWNTTPEDIGRGRHDEYFERFYRRDGSRNSQTGGTGVGLSMAQAIVEAHRGKIRAYSEDGRSLTCVVTL